MDPGHLPHPKPTRRFRDDGLMMIFYCKQGVKFSPPNLGVIPFLNQRKNSPDQAEAVNFDPQAIPWLNYINNKMNYVRNISSCLIASKNE